MDLTARPQETADVWAGDRQGLAARLRADPVTLEPLRVDVVVNKIQSLLESNQFLVQERVPFQ